MKFMDLTYLKNLKTTQSFTETAKFFMVSQPVVSLSIQRLEEEFNMQIIIRSKLKSGIEITENGLKLIDFFNKVDSEITTLQKKFKFKNSKYIHIGINYCDINLLINNFIPHFYSLSNKFKKELLIHQNNDLFLEKKLLSKNLDFVLSLSEDLIDNPSNSLKYKLIKKFNFSIVFNKILKTELSSLNNLSNYKFIATKETIFETEKIKILAKSYNINLNNIIYVDNLYSAEILIEENIGIGLFIDTIYSWSEKIETIKIPEISYLYIKYLTDNTNNPIIKIFNSI